MKKILAGIALILSLHATAQVKEGYIKFNMVLDGGPKVGDHSMFDNAALTIYFKNNKSLAKMATPIYTITSLQDDKETVVLMDGAGQKSFTRKTKEEILKNKTDSKIPDPVVVFTKEKKTILGYECTKGLVVIKDNKGRSSQMTVWHTDKIRPVSFVGILNTDALNKLKGMALEIDMEGGPIKSKMTAVEISTKPVADNIFVLSTAGFTERKLTVPKK